MRASPFAILPAFSTLIALITSSETVTSDPVDDGFCDVTISEETEFRWSKDHQAFLSISSNGSGTSRPQWEPGGNSSVLCIRAPEKHHAVLHISLNISDMTSSSTEHESFCSAPFPHECKATCISVRDPTALSDRFPANESTNSSVFEVLRDISLKFFTLSYYDRSSVKNTSKVDENIGRFPRFLLPGFKNSSENDDATSRTFDKRGARRRKRHKRKKNSWKGARVPSRKRTKRRKNLKHAAELLLEYHKWWSIDQQDAAKGENGRKYPSQKAKEARDRMLHFIDSSRRRRKLSSVKPLRTSISRSLQRPPKKTIKPSHSSNSSSTIGKIKRSSERRRRLALKSASPSAREKPMFQLSNFSFCGPGAFFRDLKTADDFRSDPIQREFPLFLHSSGREMRIEISHPLPIDDPLISTFNIKVAFSQEEKEVKDFQTSTTNCVLQDNVSPTRTQQLLSSSTIPNNTMTVITTTGEHVPVGPNNSVHIIIAVALGALMVCVSVGLCVSCVYRRKKRAIFEANTRRHHLMNEGETEKCLANAENLESHSDYNANRSSGRRQELIKVNERRMLEHKKHKHAHRKPGKVKRKEDVTDSRKTHEAKQQQQSRQHVTQCKHLLTMRGSSCHEHCIVCQIAGKPHPPIMNAQYATEFLPPASRHNNNSGYNSSPQDNFDKFNRMQNNPYRHSPSLTPKNAASLPWTIKLPDGEERYKGRRDFKLHGEGYRDPMPVCVKAPPNRTIFASEPLPFSPSSRQRHSGKISGYPGPPTSVSKSVNLERPADREDRQSRTEAPRGDCICRYIMNHIDEPPPEYSDVIREDPLPREAEGTASNTGSPESGSTEKDVSNSLPNT